MITTKNWAFLGLNLYKPRYLINAEIIRFLPLGIEISVLYFSFKILFSWEPAQWLVMPQGGGGPLHWTSKQMSQRLPRTTAYQSKPNQTIPNPTPLHKTTMKWRCLIDSQVPAILHVLDDGGYDWPWYNGVDMFYSAAVQYKTYNCD